MGIGRCWLEWGRWAGVAWVGQAGMMCGGAGVVWVAMGW